MFPFLRILEICVFRKHLNCFLLLEIYLLYLDDVISEKESFKYLK
jgi:hypothetical protein